MDYKKDMNKEGQIIMKVLLNIYFICPLSILYFPYFLYM